MTKSQKIILGLLSVIAIIVAASVVCMVIFFVLNSPAVELVPESVVVAQQPAPTPLSTSTPTSVPSPPATTKPTDTPQPSPTSTQVVVETVLPTPTPTVANCIDDIHGFGDSGVITDEQVQQYLRETVPSTHLNHCRRIEYVPKLASSHGNAISGNIIPAYREIYVYAVEPEYLSLNIVLDTVVHEIGHNVHMNIRRDNFDLDVRWAELHKQSQDMFANNQTGFVSPYAQTNKFEDFAESYRVYVRESRLLKLFNPDKYEFMRQEVFNGQEF